MGNHTRRQFLWNLAGGSAALAFGSPLESADPIRAGIIVPSDHSASSSVLSGGELGAEEAERVASLLGSAFELSRVTASTPSQAVEEGRRMADVGAAAVLGGVSAPYCEALAEALPSIFLEIRERRELAPEDRPSGNLRITPTYDEYARALVEGLDGYGVRTCAFADEDPACRRAASRVGWKEVSAERADVLITTLADGESDCLKAGVKLGPGPGVAYPVLWHHSLVRYGAGELNERFTARSDRPMDESAWAGWVAVKIVIESALRRREIHAARVDGHKGAPLEFHDGVLNQPLYVVLERDNGFELLYA